MTAKDYLTNKQISPNKVIDGDNDRRHSLEHLLSDFSDLNKFEDIAKQYCKETKETLTTQKLNFDFEIEVSIKRKQ